MACPRCPMQVHDIEELRSWAKGHRACPYFLASKWSKARIMLCVWRDCLGAQGRAREWDHPCSPATGGACPVRTPFLPSVFGTRNTQEADLIFGPYSYLVDPVIRRALDISACRRARLCCLSTCMRMGGRPVVRRCQKAHGTGCRGALLLGIPHPAPVQCIPSFPHLTGAPPTTHSGLGTTQMWRATC